MGIEAMEAASGFGARCDRALETTCPDADALLLVPPFADLYHPALGVHLLQACAGAAGFRVGVLYTNLLFATLGGERLYNAFLLASCRWMWGERLFAASAFGLPPLGLCVEQLAGQVELEAGLHGGQLTLEDLNDLERQTRLFCGSIASRIATRGVPVVGATSSFDQTAASVALLSAAKGARPQTVTILGGANCAGDLAEGIAALTDKIDYVFSGECEAVFPDFLRRVLRHGEPPSGRVIRGSPCFDLDSLPEPEFREYFAQLASALPSWKERSIWLCYESSRGCWSGVQRQCAFCGFNPETLAFRQKSPERVLAGISTLLRSYPTELVGMADNIMPHSYFRTLLPRLAETVPAAHIYYATRPDLSLEQVRLLKRAGVGVVQTGIESLSTASLRRMNKGVLARQNLALLRYARGLDMAVSWNLLCDFPGDEPQDYVAMLALVPLVRHLNPPTDLRPIVISRFSPYFREPARYGITNVRPLGVYACVFPQTAPVEKLAFRFQGDYPSAYRTAPELRSALERAVRDWILAWDSPDSPPPALELTPIDAETYLLMDTRGLPGTDMLRFLTAEQARAALLGAPIGEQPLGRWAVEAKLAVELDGWSAPLAVCDHETWRRLEGGSPSAIRPVERQLSER